MPARIRIQVDRIGADLAAGRLRQEGIPVQVVSDDDRSFGLASAGTPMLFSLVVPAEYEAQARGILAAASKEARSPRHSRTRDDARPRRRR